VDEQGRARVPFTRAGSAQVYVVYEPTLRTGQALRVADLRQGPARVDLTLPAERTARLAVRIDGNPGLPAEYVLPTVGVHGIEEDAQRGWLTFTLPASATQTPAPSVYFDARGFMPVSVPLALEPGSTRLEGSVDLQHAGVLVVRVKKPLDGRHPYTTVQSFDESLHAWKALSPPPPPPPGQVGSLDFEDSPTEQILRRTPLPAGRYRAMDAHSGELSAEVRIIPGGSPSEVVLDLSRAATVKGTVDTPVGFEVQAARVEIEGAPTEGYEMFRPGRVEVAEDGRFQLRVPGSRPVVLRVSHPRLLPDPVLGRVEVTGGGDGVRLKLVAGPRAQFRLNGVPTMRPGQAPHVPEGLRVLLFAGDPGGAQGLEFPVRADESAYWFTGHSPGTYALWLDAGRGAPLIRRGVVLGAQETDLGELEVTEGASVRVRLKLKDGADVPLVAMRAVAEGKPAYVRSKQTQKPVLDPVLTGLGPGRFRVTAWLLTDPNGSERPRLDQVVEVPADAEEDIVLDLDLR
jgi:hypothetical protein